MKTTAYILFLFLLSLQCKAQLNAICFHYPAIGTSQGSIETSDGYLSVSGLYEYTDSTHKREVLVTKFNYGGQKTDSFLLTFGEDTWIYNVSANPLRNGRMLSAGVNERHYDADLFMFKTAINGDTVWTKSFGYTGAGEMMEYGFEAIELLDGNYLLLGSTFADSEAGNAVVMIATDTNGNKLWSAMLGDNRFYQPEFIQQLPDSSFIIAGFTSIIDFPWYDGFIMKADKNGNMLWERNYHHTNYSYFWDAALLPGGRIAAVGQTDSGSKAVCWVVITDSLGNVEQQHFYGSPFGNVWIWACDYYAEGNYLWAASGTYPWPHGGYSDGWLLKLDTTGDTLWTRKYNHEGEEPSNWGGSEDFWDVKATRSGGALLSGWASGEGNTPSGGQEAWIFCVDSNGNCPVELCYPWLSNNIEEQPTTQNQLTLYPNPFTQSIFIEGLQQQTDYTLTNIQGQTIQQGKTETEIEMQHELPTGLYFLQIDGQVFKVLKE